MEGFSRRSKISRTSCEEGKRGSECKAIIGRMPRSSPVVKENEVRFQHRARLVHLSYVQTT